MDKIKNNINKIIIDTIRPQQLTNLQELQAIHDSRKSFYKKAQIGEYTFGNKSKAIYLKSYDTIVACIYKKQLRIYGYYSQTTARHIREFAKQNGFYDEITAQNMENTCVFNK